MGMAAGLSAIFRSPIGTAIFAVEVLVWRDGFRSRRAAVLHAGGDCGVCSQRVVCWMAAVVPRSLAFGRDEIEGTTAGTSAWELASGVVATILPEVFYRIRDAFVGAGRVPAWIKPAIGGLRLGPPGSYDCRKC